MTGEGKRKVSALVSKSIIFRDWKREGDKGGASFFKGKRGRSLIGLAVDDDQLKTHICLQERERESERESFLCLITHSYNHFLVQSTACVCVFVCEFHIIMSQCLKRKKNVWDHFLGDTPTPSVSWSTRSETLRRFFVIQNLEWAIRPSIFWVALSLSLSFSLSLSLTHTLFF
jgi:hypothetical protein